MENPKSSGGMKWLIILLVVAVGGWLLFRVFVGGFSEVAVESMIEEAARRSGEDIDIDFKMDGSFDVVTDEGVVSWGAGLSENWPSDVPTYPGAEETFSAVGETDDGVGGYATFATDDSVREVIDYYVADLKANGWIVVGNFDINSSLSVSFEKGDRVMNVTAFEPGDGSTMITVGFGEQ